MTTLEAPEKPPTQRQALLDEMYSLEVGARWRGAQHVGAALRNTSLQIGAAAAIAGLSAVTSALSFAFKGPNYNLHYVAGAFAMISAILGVLSGKGGFGDRAEKHRTAANAFSSIGTSCEAISARATASNDEEAAAMWPLFDETQRRRDTVAEAAPPISKRDEDDTPRDGPWRGSMSTRPNGYTCRHPDTSAFYERLDASI